ncbi:unnamed protein product, partial [Allacma fusca]
DADREGDEETAVPNPNLVKSVGFIFLPVLQGVRLTLDGGPDILAPNVPGLSQQRRRRAESLSGRRKTSPAPSGTARYLLQSPQPARHVRRAQDDGDQDVEAAAGRHKREII